jgi:hypothetical protein
MIHRRPMVLLRKRKYRSTRQAMMGIVGVVLPVPDFVETTPEYLVSLAVLKWANAVDYSVDSREMSPGDKTIEL